MNCMDNKKHDNIQQPIVVYGMANIGCDQKEATFQTQLVVHDGEKVKDTEFVEEVELVDLKFFDDRKFGTIKSQQKIREILQEVLPKMDVDSGRDWVVVYIAYHYYKQKLLIMKDFVKFFTDIEHLLPGKLTKVKQEEPKGDKRYKSYTEALSSECNNWFIVDGCLPEMTEWRSSKYRYYVDDEKRNRIQDLVKDVYQGLKDAEE